MSPTSIFQQDQGSQQTRQSTKSHKGSNGPDKNNFKKGLRGNIAELGSHVYAYGHRDQGDQYIKTTEAIADYVGREYSKEMRVLVMNLQESEPQEPREPSEEASKFALEKYKTALSHYYKKLDKYKDEKAKVFVIIKGQCTLSMKNKIENTTDYSKWEKDDDVIKLLNALKEQAFSTVDVQYEFWTLTRSMKNVMMMRQGNSESLNAFYKRFTNTVDVAETQWGMLVPTKIGNNKSERDKFLACTFLAGVDRKKFGKPVNELNNAYLAGQKNYPSTVEAAVTMLSHYMGEKSANRNEDEDSTRAASFAQKRKSVKCYRCQKMGHYANECTEGDSDGESSVRSTRSSQSHLSTHSRRGGLFSGGYD